jgi:hypothetical protein
LTAAANVCEQLEAIKAVLAVQQSDANEQNDDENDNDSKAPTTIAPKPSAAKPKQKKSKHRSSLRNLILLFRFENVLVYHVFFCN